MRQSWWELAFLPSADTLMLFCTTGWMTVANLDGNRWRRNCFKASPSTSLFFCRSFTWHHKELFTTCSPCNFHPRFYKTLNNAFGKILNVLSLFLYKHGDITTASGIKKIHFPAGNNPGKQELSGPLTFLLKNFDQSLSTGPSVVLFIWEKNKDRTFVTSNLPYNCFPGPKLWSDKS